MANPLHIPKPLPHRVQELIQSMLVLRDCIEHVRSGKFYHFIPIYGQLRALLIEKSNKNKPLLVDLASILKQPMNIWCMGPAGPDEMPMPEEWKAAMVFNVSGFPVSLHQQLAAQKLISIEELLEHKIIYYDKHHYKTSEIIGFFANNAGGSHYSTKIKKDFAQMLTIGLNGQPVLINFLLQIAEVTYELGLRVLKRLNDLEIHLAAIIGEQEVEGNRYLFDTKYPDTPMRASIVLRNGNGIVFQVTGLDGTRTQVVTNRIMALKTPHYIVFLHQIDNKLRTKMKILVDGETYGEFVFDAPCFFVNELRAQITYHNRSVDEDNTGAKWAMFSLAMTDPEGSVTDRSRLFVHFSELLSDDEKSGVVYMSDGYSHAEPGTTNQELVGNFFWSRLGRVAKGDWSDPKQGDKDVPNHTPEPTQ